MAASKRLYEAIVEHFPKSMRMAFAYGSGVFKQATHQDLSKNMVDFIFVVDDPTEWHRENLITNSKHYSFLRHFGPHSIERFQNFAARIYFNTLVPCEGRMIKYGVISTDALRMDLLNWDFLYASGRLHKPVYHVVQNLDKELDVAIQKNLHSAIHTALLILPDQFKEQELYEAITEISYTGDFRMTVGEDKNKIKNIVQPNMDYFRELYAPIIEEEEHVYWHKYEGVIEQSLCHSSRIHHLNLLPKVLTEVLVAQANLDRRNRDAEEVIRTLAHNYQCRYLVQNSVAKIVKTSSSRQAIKGLFTAGITKSFVYSLSKLRKMKRSQRV